MEKIQNNNTKTNMSIHTLYSTVMITVAGADEGDIGSLISYINDGSNYLMVKDIDSDVDVIYPADISIVSEEDRPNTVLVRFNKPSEARAYARQATSKTGIIRLFAKGLGRARAMGGTSNRATDNVYGQPRHPGFIEANDRTVIPASGFVILKDHALRNLVYSDVKTGDIALFEDKESATSTMNELARENWLNYGHRIKMRIVAVSANQ